MTAFTRSALFSDLSARLRLPGAFLPVLRRAAAGLRAIPPEERSPAGLLAEENTRFLQEEAEELRRRLRDAPRLPIQGHVPRVLLLAEDLLSDEQTALTPGSILRRTRAFFQDTEPEHRELCCLPDALAVAALKKMIPVLERCAGETELRRKAVEWARRLRAGITAVPSSDPILLERIWELLSRQGDQDALRAMEALSRCGGQELLMRAHTEMTRQEEELRYCLRVLRQLPSLPFSALIERLSPVAQILRQEETYRRMDAESRNYYVSRVLFLSDRLRVGAPAVARAALFLAQGKTGFEGESGYYLIERTDRIASYLLKRGNVGFLQYSLMRSPWLVAAISALLWGMLALWTGVPLYAIPLFILCGGEGTRLLLRPLLRGRFPARMLPRIRASCLPRDTRVLVAVPALLLSVQQALRLCRHLAVLKENAPRADILLLGDYPDSDRAEEDKDTGIAQAALAAIEALNQRQGGGFLLLLRKRTWDPGQRQFTGWERKRGALLTLNRLLTGRSDGEDFACRSCDPAQLRNRYAYVLTLDADTFLPAGAVEKLAGSMEHPLQKGRLSVVQPVMEVAPDRVITRLQRWLGGQGGDDAYHLSRQEAYQDVFGRGSFVGKGIYEPKRWMEKTEGHIPEGRILSHDLLEGELAGCALADDILLFDGHPAKLSGWQKRLHRWTRGDWQLLPFLASKALDGLSKYKLYDNLRRSLLPAAQVPLLLLGTALRQPLMLLAGLPWPVRGMYRRLLLLPGKAYTLLDAVFRALYRQFFSHRNLLQWVTAEQAENGSGLPLGCVLAQLLCGGALILVSLLPGGFLPAVWLGGWWLTGLLLIPYLEGKDRPEQPLNRRQQAAVRQLARDTWRFFADHVTAETLFLPPDNVQEDPDKGPALRTSPTNIGLYLLSCAAAQKLHIISVSEMAERMQNTLETLEKLPLWRGHLYNWYDITDGEPLRPRFVSTVDSGNLAACLLACAQVCRSLLREMEEPFRSLPTRLDAFARRMDFTRLYDWKRGLFSIGFDVDRRCLSAAHYDRMASEARLASFVAIRFRQVPRKHWRRLNRSVTRAGGGAALLSWGGTAFEYLLPSLLLPSIQGTLIGEGCGNAVRAQMTAAAGRPFGISESGYFAFDPELNYQYRAFGLPELAVSSDTAGSVVAPYASLLALPFFPAAVARNLERMRKLGWTDEHGLYEAADYSPSRFGTSPRIVKSHMAHHQGMILCAVCNALTDFSLVRAFMLPPEAEACADLLWEKAVPVPRKRAALPASRTDSREEEFSPRNARKDFPMDAQAMFGHGTTWVITGQGSGYLSARGVMITRFREECFLPSGPQLYLRDEKNGEFRNLLRSSEMIFESGCVRCEGTFGTVKYVLLCFVTPLEGMAVQMLMLENAGKEEAVLTAASFLEVAQGSQKADQAHPNYRDLSVQVMDWGDRGLCSRRLPRDEKDEAPMLYHAVTGAVDAVRKQGDRRLFLGRNGTYDRPEQLSCFFGEARCRVGDVLAPCLSLRARTRVKGKSVLCFVTFAEAPGKLPEPAALSPERMAEKLSLARTQYQMTLRSLRINGEQLSLCRQILGAALFTFQPHQRKTPLSSRNALWACGVSGDLPVLLADMRENDRALIRNVLMAYGWMRLQGVWTDLIFLLPPEHEYCRPIRDALTRQAALTPFGDLMEREGGLHIITDDGQRRAALSGAARLTLTAGIPLAKQLSSLREAVPYAHVPAVPEPIQPPALRCFNGAGGFSEDGAYWITAPAPVPWHHFLSGRRFGTLVTEQGILQSFGENSYLDRITLPAPDVHRSWESEEIMLCMEDGQFFPLARCTAVFSPGIAEYHTCCGELNCEMKVFSHPERPFGIRQIVLRGNGVQALRLLYRPHFALGETPEYTRTERAAPFLFSRSASWKGVAWAALTGDGDTHTEAGDGLCCTALLRPHEACVFTALLGIADDPEAARAALSEIRRQGVGALERETRAFWQRRLSGLRVYGAGIAEEFLFNGFIPYQVWASRFMSRSGPYQQGGAYGFRDQLQDLLALMYTAPQEAREHLLRCAAHQFPGGDVQHWWHEPRTGVRTRISDDRLFLPFLTAEYVIVTGDADILAQSVPYLCSAELREDERERYETPEVTPFAEPLLEHCLRAIRSVRLGGHGLPLMGGGDWNDGLNRVGGKRGESVWLGFFLVLVLKQFAPLCAQETAEELHQIRRELLRRLESAWTGQWYLRAWRDSGAPLGGPDTEPPRIDLIVQCFSVLAGAPRDHARAAVYHAAERLYDREHGLVRLTDIPYTPQEDAGYIGAYLPGVRENGGQYTHAVPWLIQALCELGENELAWEITDAVLPLHHGDSPEKTRVYEVEPYVFCGDVYTGQNMGRGGWSWYTGSAAWMYHVYFTVLLGFEKRGNKARLRPHARQGQEEYTVVYRFGDSLYHFTASPDVLFPTLDGEKLPDGWALLRDDGHTHEARYPMR